MQLADRLLELRKGKGLKQKDCAAELGVESSKYNKWENGKNAPDYDTICLLADYFDVTTDYLLGRSNIKRQVSMIEEYQWVTEEAKKTYNKAAKKSTQSLILAFKLYKKELIEACDIAIKALEGIRF